MSGPNIMADSNARDLAQLSKRLGHDFVRPDLLLEGLTHPSMAGMGGHADLPHYQRLEFLGDRVLGLVVAQVLLERFPHEKEGDIAKRHTGLVRTETLARVAKTLELGRHVRMSPGEQEGGGRSNPAILADVCEAVIGAMYLDGGLPVAEKFVRDHWMPMVDIVTAPPQDPKTALQEWAQGRGYGRPAYIELDRRGPAHAPVFVIEAGLIGFPSITAEGQSKRAAEKAAAAMLLARLKEIVGDV